jgi:choline dehydrogenase-like flavoprotein
MEQNFDVIVIGAGNGGMTGALTLCKAGKKVLLAEQHSITGYLLNRLREGEELISEGSEGQFYHFPAVHGNRLRFVASGSGITPFMSMIRTNTDRLSKGVDITLIYGSAKDKFRKQYVDHSWAWIGLRPA